MVEGMECQGLGQVGGGVCFWPIPSPPPPHPTGSGATGIQAAIHLGLSAGHGPLCLVSHRLAPMAPGESLAKGGGGRKLAGICFGKNLPDMPEGIWLLHWHDSKFIGHGPLKSTDFAHYS